MRSQGGAIQFPILLEVRQAETILHMPKTELSDTDLEIRRSSWAHIRQIISDKTLTDGEKLRKCLNEASIYAALTGDDALFPQQIRDEHNEMCKWIKQNMEKIKKGRAAAERDAATGQPMFGE